MIHQLNNFDDKVLVEIRIIEHGTEFFTSNDFSILKRKINDANKEHGLQFEKDFTSLNGIKKDMVETKFEELSQSWGLKYKKL